MKRLFIYFSKTTRMDSESEKLQRVQIDHCLSLGYRSEDITFVSNSPLSYNGVTSLTYHPRRFPPIHNHVKGWYLSELYSEGVLHGAYWLTDYDLFQLAPLDRQSPIAGLDTCIYGIDTFGRLPHKASEINFCGAFISEKSLPFLTKLRSLMHTSTTRYFHNEERAATHLHLRMPNVLSFLDKRYNIFAWNNLKAQYELAKKPIIGIHFHPSSASAMTMMCSGNNSLGFALASEDLSYCLKLHGFQAPS